MTDRDVDPDEMPTDLDELLQDLRAAAAASPPPAPGAGLATLFRDGTSPQPAPALRRHRRRVRVAVVGAVAATSFGSLGVAGALPAPVQERVAELAEQVGIDLPDGQPEPPSTTVVRPTTTTTQAPTSTTDPADQPADDAPPARSEEDRADDETPTSTVPDRPDTTPRSTVPDRPDTTPRSTVPDRRPEPARTTADHRDGRTSPPSTGRERPAEEDGDSAEEDGDSAERPTVAEESAEPAGTVPEERNPRGDVSVDAPDRRLPDPVLTGGSTR